MAKKIGRNNATKKIPSKIIVPPILEKTLENDKYNWRTLKAITVETKISKLKAIKIIGELEEEGLIIKGRRISDNEEIYTTRKHYKEKSSLLTRVMDVALGKVER
jgi:hypothetical protein